MSELSRRDLLALSAGGLAMLAGCSESAPVESPSVESSSVFEDVSFEGTDMVVDLRADHDIDRVNLVSPDGTLFTSATVPVGTTTVRLQVLDLEVGDPTHYTIGSNTLVATSGERVSEELEIDLSPEISVDDIVQYHHPDSTSSGYLSLSLSNSGSAPTWVYDITYSGAPNYNANQDLVDDPGIPQLAGLDERNEAILGPDDSKQLASLSRPLVFSETQADIGCEITTAFTVIVGVASGQDLTIPVEAVASGEIEQVGTFGRFTCSTLTVDKGERN